MGSSNSTDSGPPEIHGPGFDDIEDRMELWPYKMSPQKFADAFDRRLWKDIDNDENVIRDSQSYLNIEAFKRGLPVLAIVGQHEDEPPVVIDPSDPNHTWLIEAFEADKCDDPEDSESNCYNLPLGSITTGDGPCCGDIWYEVTPKLVNTLFPDKKATKKKRSRRKSARKKK